MVCQSFFDLQKAVYKVTKKHKPQKKFVFQPTFVVISPTMMTTLLKAAKQVNCDFSCFELIYIGGSAVPKTLVEEMKVCDFE